MIKIGIVFGGRSGEHEVSLVSASNVIKALDPEKYEVHLIGITKDGKWVFGADSLKALKKGSSEGLDEGDIMGRLSELDIVFPVLHGPYGEDGTIQGLLEIANIPYVGCGVMASSIAMDKLMTKAVWEQAGLPQVPYTSVMRHDWEASRDTTAVMTSLEYPVFVKPANMGSSVGISKAKDEDGLRQAIDLAIRFDRKVVIEQGMDIREIEVAVLGNDNPEIGEIGEVLVGGEFYDFNDKYVDGKSSTQVPADLTNEQRTAARELAIQAFKTIDGSGMARVDLFLTKDGKFYLNEINTIPGFTSISMYPKMWEAAGTPYQLLIDRLIGLALERHNEKSRNQIVFESGSDWYQG
ncbi:D-alanine--D-alanine ligase A [Candidatus Peregrinibacteria bacterium CG22_combo_CG10-13_8_21_14_all_44_10]|nr:MAG: D-alanine--D-alanine ligase A [Candidatus Peregrinibacteria bacterium CG2_30_44_17]PIP65859.1 MAG: D-alanine--D-alanine ligase A [Candidatus Peregrinibacteria bacterium CG22_combo_CG10-13_8_21_14_all_44_10]PIS03590.1 MAG: D-alanine--D-alanine ligase A [Candidatus Peregrinibacteria bacterium CG10_big_fil_rev_8_21_14_0_10_44_7]PIX80615.1 MAG: D-alanine--D-alanine ligase A [Candidatus Peregrinibacteria bacterium CG_4_10_14_3_um_filter_44_21]PJB88606.1 MAG: D-alanine--D-alanine ligase A [Ca